MITDKALKKARILAFWEKHGLKATLDAFNVKKRTLYYWKQNLQEGNGKLEALNDKSTIPQTKRIRIWSDKII